MHKRSVTYGTMAKRPNDVWLFQYRPITVVDRVICRATMSKHSHSALAFWHEGELVHVDSSPSHGISVTPVADIIAAYADKIDVFRIDYWARRYLVNDAIKRHALSQVGKPYGWASARRLIWLNTPVLWRFAGKVSTEKLIQRRQVPTCSQFVSYCFSRAGLDPVPRTPDWAVVPGDFTKSLAFQFDGVLAGN